METYSCGWKSNKMKEKSSNGDYLNDMWNNVNKTLKLNCKKGIFIVFSQDIDEEWPLVMIDLTGEKQEIFLKPGKLFMIWWLY